MANTIYALSTSFSKSAIAIIRVSGSSSKKSLYTLSNIKNPIPFRFTLTTLRNKDNSIIDKPLVVYFPKNNSYTNEDLVEYHIHGSIAVIKELLGILGSFKDHRLAYPGEFTKRALENDKISLIEAEGLLDLIESETILQKKQAIQTLNGESFKKYKNWLDIIKNNLSLLEASIDFVDEDLPENLTKNITENIINLIKVVKDELNNYKCTSKLKDGIKLAIIGSTNVGKSTLINYLAKDDIAIISNIPGTTRDAISVSLDFSGFPILITDTAGIRSTSDEIENLGIKKSINKAKESDLKLIVVDSTRLVNNLNEIEYFVKDNYIFIINKIDLIKEEDKKNITNILDKKNIDRVFISLKESIGLDEFKKILKNKLQNITKCTEHPAIINERHKNIVEDLLFNLEEIINKKDIIIKSYFLRNAMNSLGKVIGLNNIEDILDIIFSNFCIGK